MVPRSRNLPGASLLMGAASLLGGCKVYDLPEPTHHVSIVDVDGHVTEFYQRYLAGADVHDPGEAAYAITVGHQWLSRDGMRNAFVSFENARQLLEHEKTSYEGRERRDPEGYHRGRAEVEAALVIVLSRLAAIDPNPLYLGQLDVEWSLFHSDRRALEVILDLEIVPLPSPHQ